MSSTHGTADPLGRYYTPDALAATVLQLPVFPDASAGTRRILEPHAGAGAFVRAVVRRYRGHSITALDIDPNAPALRERILGVRYECADFLTYADTQDYDIIVGNPPFNAAEAHIRHALSLLALDGQLVFLLRLAFLAGQKRGDKLWQEHPPERVYVLSKRPSFTDTGTTDSAEYAIYTWRAGWRGTPALHWLQW